MRDHGHDLRYYRTNCPKIGPNLFRKLPLYCGDVYRYYLNLTVYLLENFLKNMLISAFSRQQTACRWIKGISELGLRAVQSVTLRGGLLWRQ